MRSFNSIDAFLPHLARMHGRGAAHAQKTLDKAAAVVQQAAKDRIGVPEQPAAGPFVAWAPLADSTQEERARLGYPPADALLRSGETRDSIERNSEGSQAVVGSNSDILLWQELGTRSIPPRSVLGAAAVEEGDRVTRMLGQAVVKGIIE